MWLWLSLSNSSERDFEEFSWTLSLLPLVLLNANFIYLVIKFLIFFIDSTINLRFVGNLFVGKCFDNKIIPNRKLVFPLLQTQKRKDAENIRFQLILQILLKLICWKIRGSLFFSMKDGNVFDASNCLKCFSSVRIFFFNGSNIKTTFYLLSRLSLPARLNDSRFHVLSSRGKLFSFHLMLLNWIVDA